MIVMVLSHNEYMKKYRAEHRESMRAYDRELYHKNHLKRREVSQKSLQKCRMELFKVLGGVKCVRCGFMDIRALQFDHINGDGYTDAKRFGKGTGMAYKGMRYYRDNPEEAKSKLQVLCANCNWIKRAENKEVSRYSVIYTLRDSAQ